MSNELLRPDVEAVSAEPSVSRAMCLECGALRSVSARCSLRYGRDLRCSVCDRTTRHRAADPTDTVDFRESRNEESRKAGAKLRAKTDKWERHEVYLRELLGRVGVDVKEVPALVCGGRPCMYTLDRWIVPGSDRVVWLLTVPDNLTAAGRVWSFRDAWNVMAGAGVGEGGKVGLFADHDEYRLNSKGQLWLAIYQPVGKLTEVEGSPVMRDVG